MSLTFKIKRGSAVQTEVFTGQQGELTMITDSGKESVVLHDGATQGGVELARRDLANVQIPLGGVTFEYKYEKTAMFVRSIGPKIKDRSGDQIKDQTRPVSFRRTTTRSQGCNIILSYLITHDV